MSPSPEMMSTPSTTEIQNSGRRRATKACKRCRDQKIRCTGTHPCPQCGKRGLACYYEDQSQKVIVSRRYINGLQQKIASLEQKRSVSTSPTANRQQEALPSDDDTRTSETKEQPLAYSTARNDEASLVPTKIETHAAESDVPLTNPLAFHITTDWVPGPKGLPSFMGTSSNWSFGRRVLNMTYERVMGTSSPTDNLHYDGEVYDLQWNGCRKFPEETPFDLSALPTQDFAIYLINSVKFHCCRLFHLFEEEPFMKQFTLFHEDPIAHTRQHPLWFVHYLLILAFGKSFVVQSSKTIRPPGTELFIQAMRLMPDINFLDADPVEKTQVLCCAALYFHCLDHRAAAYRNIGQAVRVALEHGMHTDMRTSHLTEAYKQRCHTAWWTAYILERQMSSLMGLPIGIADEYISTPFPSFDGQPQRLDALKIQVELSRVLAQIDQTVYGIEGKLDSRYLGATQSVLRNIAHVTEQLNNAFGLHTNDAMTGISRVSAHLHLHQHQSIILTTRPLLYIFLRSKLGQSEAALMHWLQSESVKGLIQICIESAQQIIRILSLLSDQGLLEVFLPFDKDAAFTATISLLMAAGIDSSILQDHSPWTQRAYAILAEISSRGNAVAELILRELKQIDSLLDELSAKENGMMNASFDQTGGGHEANDMDISNLAFPSQTQSADDHFSEEFGLLNYELTAEQLMNIADSLDIDSFTWPVPEPNE